jgi:hypothetical protein
MPLRLTSIVFEATDVGGLAYFWQGMVERWRAEPANGEERCVPEGDDEYSTLDLVFAPASRARPKTGKNRIHLDVRSDSMPAYRANREALPLIGAREIDIGQGDLVPWTVYADPEDNEFCVLKPGDRYAETGAIAAVVVDSGDPQLLASFWSAATGWPVVESEQGFAALRAPGDPPRGPYLEFSRVSRRNPEPSPVSLGFESYWAHQHDDDLAGLLALGARVIGRHDGEVSHTVLADPEGNQFRVVIPVWPPRQ